MHSRIFQITKAPIQEDDYITQDYFDDHWFVGSIADYVAGDLIRETEIEDFRKSLETSGVAMFDSLNSFTILPDGKTRYFEGAYTQFIAAAQKAASINLDAFSCSLDCASLVHQIRNSYCDRFDLYVSSDDFETIPMDEFLRDTEPGKTYYIGNVLDYHY